MAALDLIAAARDETFAARVAFCLMKSGLNTANEDPGTSNHTNRLAFAERVLKGEINSKLAAAAVIAYSSGLQTTINATPANKGSDVIDSALQTAVDALIDLWANAWAAGV
jgi:hypothetical protein